MKNIFARHKIITGIVVVIAIGAIASSNNKSTNDATVKPPVASTPTTNASTNATQKQVDTNTQKTKDGVYKVGTDIAPGEYSYICSNSNGYIENSKDSTGALTSINYNMNLSKLETGFLELQDGEYIKIKGTMLTLKDSTNTNKFNLDELNKTTNPSFMCKVGRDIDPGEYQVQYNGGNAYYEVSKDASHRLTSIKKNSNPTGNEYITLVDGDYIRVKNMKLVKQ